MMARYRYRPVLVEAVEWDGTAEGATPIIDWILSNDGTAIYECDNPECTGTAEAHHLAIKTLEGNMRANPGDWIVRGTRGEFYPVEPGPFADTFEQVDRARPGRESPAHDRKRLNL